MSETALILEELKLKLEERKAEVFIPLPRIIKQMFENLELLGDIKAKQIKDKVIDFYQTCIDYLSQWDAAFKDIIHFDWVHLNKVPSWEVVEKSLNYVEEFRSNTNIQNNELFDEVSCVKRYANADKIEEWKTENVTADNKWLEIFKHFQQENIDFKNVLKLVEFSLCLPASNAPTERVFSISNNIWTSEKSQLKVNTLESLLITKINFDMDCAGFKNFLQNNADILKKIHSTEKYQK